MCDGEGDGGVGGGVLCEDEGEVAMDTLRDRHRA